jgi:hypothetical protein
LPDFAIEDDESGRTVYWEHLGLLNDEGYRRRWEAKRAMYELNDIFLHDDERVGEKILVETRDDERGGIDSVAIVELIEKVLG